ncbi:MAG: tryptophan synthase subunit alpha [Candidatus Zixiibacteriota bacterium]|nr:MAG: tryptophan synthase subunit alpha [candidate division Zixibacteria bacterium]
MDQIAGQRKGSLRMTMKFTISQTFAQNRIKGKKALIPFLTSGFPDRHTFKDLVRAISHGGADLTEIGIPFSDPLADGPTIQKSSQRALSLGVNVERIFDYINCLNSLTTPLIVMSYFNPIYHYGIERFVRSARHLRIGGLIVPDLIPEEGKQLETLCRSNHIDLIYLLSPTSSDDRTDMILDHSRGFVYLVTVAGVTGSRNGLPDYLSSWIKRVKKKSLLPACVGFGISTVGQARQVCRYADGVIVGSALINIILSTGAKKRMVEESSIFIRTIRKGLDRE